MTQEQEADKAHEQTHNVVQLVPPVTPQYQDVTKSVYDAISESARSGVQVDLPVLLRMLDPQKANSQIRDLLDNLDLMSKRSFDAMMRGLAREQQVIAVLDYYPRTAAELVEEYTRRRKLRVTARGSFECPTLIQVGDLVVDEHVAAQNECVRNLFDIAAAERETQGDVERELRLINDNLKLGFRDTSIRDSLDNWVRASKARSRANMLDLVMYKKGKATGPVGQQLWKDMDDLCFEDPVPGFSSAILQFFMWQVKRKALGLRVINHLMPVLVGPQGLGKSSFVTAMCGPLQEAMADTSFGEVGDERNSALWDNNILFLDEMSGAAKADMEKTKHAITAYEMGRRVMGTGRFELVRQCATLIGCSNKSVGQLINDDTGMRRFAELVFHPKDLGKARKWLESVDWTLMWQSVNEREIRHLDKDVAEALAAQQSSVRQQGAVEAWARDHMNKFKKPTLVSNLYEHFRSWADQNFPGDKTSVKKFGRDMNQLMRDHQDFPAEAAGRISGGNRYQWRNV